MDDLDIARTLRVYADLLEISGDNPFRANAFRRAADAVDGMAGEVEETSAEELAAVPGIGPGTAAAVRDLVETGHFAPLDELLQRVPVSVLELLEVSGIGAKSAGRFYRELGIGSLSELETAAQAGRIGSLKGFGARQEQRILEGIAFLRSRDDQINIGAARPLAQDLVEGLRRELAGRVEIAGSVRRWRETVGGIDLIAESTGAAEIEAALRATTNAASVTTAERLVEARLPSGIRLRVGWSPPSRFGTALAEWTGSSGHLDDLRRRAGGPLPLAAEEAELYAALGLEWVPPELRQGRDEVALAAKHRLPVLVNLRDLHGDLHLHSDWSDGHATILELAQAARARGYQYLSIADHSGGLAVANGLTVERLREQRRLIDAVNEQVPEVRLLRAAEVEVHRDGRLDFPDEVLAELDLVVASLHSGLRAPVEAQTARMLKVLHNPHVDIVAHPKGRLIGKRPGTEYDWEQVFRAAAETGTALEINSHPARQDLSDELARQAAAAGVQIAIDSDAHDLAGLDLQPYGVAIARRAAIGPQAVVNARNLADLLAWLSRS